MTTHVPCRPGAAIPGAPNAGLVVRASLSGGPAVPTSAAPRRWLRASSLALAPALLLALALACSRSSDGPKEATAVTPTPTLPSVGVAQFDSLPEAPAPGGLADLTLPAQTAIVLSLLERLPGRVAGFARVPLDDFEGGRYKVHYGEPRAGLGPPLEVMALDFSGSASTPGGESAAGVLLTISQGAGWDVLAKGRDRDLIWVHWVTTQTGTGAGSVTKRVQVLQWADLGGQWIFGVAAEDFDGVTALLDAFVSAAAKVAQ